MDVAPLTAHDLTALLRRVALDVDPTIGPLRELTQNGIDACLRAGGGNITWTSTLISGHPRLCVIDQGVGMTASDAATYLGQIGLSAAQDTSLAGNHGVGGRLSLLVTSSAGVIYRSWRRPGNGVELELGTDPQSGQFGIRSDNGRKTRAISWDLAPDQIKEAGHGTIVILLGTEKQPNSTLPADPKEPTDHVHRTLTQRYATIDDGVAVYVDRSLRGNAAETTRIDGIASLLESSALDRGTVRLTRATAHWWLLPTKKTSLASGHVASLFGSELYDLQAPGRGGFARMSQFGVRASQERVVIWIEPESGLVASSPSRMNLALHPDRPVHAWPGHAELPWKQWGAEFSRALPTAIAALTLAATDADTRDPRKAAAQVLRYDRGLRPPPRFSPDHDQLDDSPTTLPHHPSSGSLLPDPKAKAARRTLELFEDLLAETPAGAERLKALKADAVRDRSLSEAEPDEHATTNPRSSRTRKPARRSIVGAADLPSARWISTQDGTRPNGYLTDRVASYDPDAHELTINADHRLLAALIDQLVEGRPKQRVGLAKTLANEYGRQAWYTQLAAKVLRAQQLSEASAWDKPATEQLLSPESLTLAMSYSSEAFVLADRNMRRQLGSVSDE